MLLGTDARIVGRGRTADFVVLDARVSRQHLRVVAEQGGARIEVIEGAEPLLADGIPQRNALLRIGETVIIGETALTLTPGPPETADDGLRTDVRQLMTGLAADVSGLTAVVELADALDATTDEVGILAAVGTWAQRHVGALDVALATQETDGAWPPNGAAPVRSLVESRGREPSTVLVSVPAHAGGHVASFTFTCKSSDGRITNTMRRLLVVAARLAGSSLTRARILQRAQEDRDLFRQVSLGSARSFLGDSPAARELWKLAGRLASSDTTILLEGETGVGKTFLARLIHESGERAKEPLRIINCASIPESLIESELFGHERGAFTGAGASRAGAFESAGRGTILLDEIGELPPASQAKLLRVLEEKRFERLGSNRAVRLTARVITATNRDLATEAEEGTFRRDLYYRIAVVKLRIPPLRERGEDVVLLAMQMLADLAPTTGRRVEGFSPEAREAIRHHPWPGNVRELRNAIERALVVGDRPLIQPSDLPDAVLGAVPPQPDDASLARLPMRLDLLEERAIQAALRHTGGNQRRAAAVLGMSRVTLHRKLRTKSPHDLG
jgi:DNA-binding NtrC family response regulator